jgi:hypothetical protein
MTQHVTTLASHDARSAVRVCPFIVPLQNLVLPQPSLRPSLDKEKTNVSVQEKHHDQATKPDLRRSKNKEN